ncbi:MAG: hypothetical protein ABH823_03195 [bacterium]
MGKRKIKKETKKMLQGTSFSPSRGVSLPRGVTQTFQGLLRNINARLAGTEIGGRMFVSDFTRDGVASFSWEKEAPDTKLGVLSHDFDPFDAGFRISVPKVGAKRFGTKLSMSEDQAFSLIATELRREMDDLIQAANR